ncbi:hypothetical protein B0H14DRAFT_3500731 [Mycena olivaceomarginata]|nr:hypothetical protein B0H14DRAFT_3500731 [Mycena olivaceomarginata]
MVIEARREAANYRRTTTAGDGQEKSITAKSDAPASSAPVAEAESSQLQTEGGVDLGEGTKSHLLEAESEPQDRRADAEVADSILEELVDGQRLSPNLSKTSKRLGGEIRGEIDDCDPLETCGDAAMHVVITEILVARLRDEPDGKAIYNAIHGPLLSNSTFLPKFPGNAFEVFAGALALKKSPAALKQWISVTFEELINAAVEACRDFVPLPSSSTSTASINVVGPQEALAEVSSLPPEGFDFLLPPKLAWDTNCGMLLQWDSDGKRRRNESALSLE